VEEPARGHRYRSHWSPFEPRVIGENRDDEDCGGFRGEIAGLGAIPARRGRQHYAGQQKENAPPLGSSNGKAARRNRTKGSVATVFGQVEEVIPDHARGVKASRGEEQENACEWPRQKRSSRKRAEQNIRECAKDIRYAQQLSVGQKSHAGMIEAKR